MSKRISVLIGGCSLLFLFFGIAAAAEPEIVLMHDKGGAPNYQPVYEAMSDACFEATGVAFKQVPYPTTEIHMAAVRTALPTNKAPELFTWWSTYRMKPLIDAGLLADLTNLWDARKGEYDPGVRGAFEFNGRVYGLPGSMAYWVVWYHKPLFEQYGLSRPNTWDEFIELCDFFKSRDIIPLGATVQGRWPTFIYTEQFLVGMDPDFYEALMVGKAKYTDETAVKAFEVYKDMLKKGYFSDPGTDIWTDFPRLFGQGKAAMILMGSWYAVTLESAGLKIGEDFDAFLMPSVNPKSGKVVIYEASSPVLVGKKSVGLKDALKVAAWWLTPEGQYMFGSLSGGQIPCNTATDISYLPQVKQNIVKTLKTEGYRLVNRYWEATPTDICEEAVDKFAEFILKPDAYMQVLGDLEKIAQDYWREHK